MKMQVPTEKDWQQIVEAILPQLKHNILLLKGNLGAGKTTFTQILLREMGSTDEVSSPTYAIVNEYITPKGNVFHFDLYRLKNINEAFDIGIEEYLEGGYLSIIEWPEIYESELKNWDYHEITIEHDGDSRTLHFV